MLQNMTYVMYKNTHIGYFSFFILCNLIFPLMNSLVYIKIDQDIFLDVVFKLHEMKNEKFFEELPWALSLVGANLYISEE